MAVTRFDAMVRGIADSYGLVYTRYADDLTLSTDNPKFGRATIGPLIYDVYKCMGKFGLSPNVSKTHVSPPEPGRLYSDCWLTDMCPA